jgi:hypothetical protein
MRKSPPARAPAAADLDVVLDRAAPPGNLIPALAQLLRRLRDRARARQLPARPADGPPDTEGGPPSA